MGRWTSSPKPTQHARALGVLRSIPVHRSALERLSVILDESQNPLPDGQSDGSISMEQWIALKALEVQTKVYAEALSKARLILEGK